MATGFLGRCPHCGEGKIFGRFLKVRPECEACGLEMHHHRADDLPPYIVIFIVGHIVGYALLKMETEYDVPLWFQLSFWPIVTLIMAMALLQPVKGAVVGLQYALGMHGFATLPLPRAEAAVRPEDLQHGPDFRRGPGDDRTPGLGHA
ncbi:MULTISPECIES: DUF983 domain-containing protein [unclassified Methylobacterium]|uniref:DUF983 domain-containing protein n=1 Tax=unclassified Methylobacterium TaxID=2615210 RepID=UPI0009EB8073|nr:MULTISPECIES: DUF983 domain-containing protein [unclassified Methylobacterium]